MREFIYKSNRSIVRAAINLRTGEKRVFKTYKRNDENLKKAINEINCLKKLDHPNIIKVLEYFIDDTSIYIIF